MFEQLNNQLSGIREKLRLREKLQSNLSRAQESLNQEKVRLRKLELDLRKEGSDVRKLEGLSLTGLFYSILGSREEQLDKERQEHLAAKLKYEECKYAIASIEREIADLKQQIGQLGDLETQYQTILERKESLITKAGDENSQRLAQLSDGLANVQADIRELQEAIAAGNRVLDSLNELIASLESAGTWGTWDLLGGGIIATAIKHSRVDDARDAVHRVQQLLRRFQRELADVELSPESDVAVEIGSFATFADYFFDGLITDWVVQSRIHRALHRGVRMRDRVRRVVMNLKNQVDEMQERAEHLRAEGQRLIERV